MKRTPLYLALIMAVTAVPSGVFAQAANDDLTQAESAADEASEAESSSAEQLDSVTVYGDVIALDGVMSDQQAYDAVYDDNYSSDFIGKQRIDTYRGTNPADVLQSFTGIYSGDARNSGAIDPNVRGLQGEGRVPVRIDGTEQAITANRGYAGANNRNYIDPMLIGGIRVVKDSGLDTGVKTGIGGGIEIRTLNVNDFIEDEGFGGEIRVEAGTNATDPRIQKDYDGEKMVDIPGAEIKDGEWDSDNLFVQPMEERDNDDQFNLFKGDNYAGRIAMGYKADNWDVMGAVARRKSGNYFSGKNGAEYYSDEVVGTGVNQDIIHVLANYYPPETEVFNTSSENTSYLFKLGFQPTDEQKINVNFRNTQSEYGEIMPSYLRRRFADGSGMQIPLSTMDINATSVQYALNPADNDWVNFKANLWHTASDSDTYNSAGDIARVKNNGTTPQKVCNGIEFLGSCYDADFNDIGYDISTEELNDDYLVNNAKIHTKHTRYGIDLSNNMQVSDSVDVTVFGSLQKEDIKQSVDELKQDWAQYPREGRRQEWGLGLNTHWQATDKLSFDIGGQYSSYWLKDDLRAANDDDPNYASQQQVITYSYYTKTQADIDEFLTTPDSVGRTWLDIIALRCSGSTDPNCAATEQATILKHLFSDGREHKIVWEPDANGHYSRDSNPCYNGTIASLEGINTSANGLIDPVTCPATVKSGIESYKPSETKPFKDHAFTPALAVNYELTDDARIYARYNESVRYPNSYEGLFGFGVIPSYYGLDPERSHKFELGYVHNLATLLPSADVADIKLTYYQNNIDDYIDVIGFDVRNLDKKKTRGLELQARYDNGKFFGDIGINHVLKNQVCDEHLGVMQDYHNDHSLGGLGRGEPPHQGKRCFTDGVPSGQSVTNSVPEWAAKLHLGGRFLDDKLEAGTRLSYYSGNDNDDYWQFLDGINKSNTNTPYGWDDTLLVDAYVRYQLNKNFQVELSGQNLTDRFYVDPASRTPIAGPGRMFKLNLTGRF